MVPYYNNTNPIIIFDHPVMYYYRKWPASRRPRKWNNTMSRQPTSDLGLQTRKIHSQVLGWIIFFFFFGYDYYTNLSKHNIMKFHLHPDYGRRRVWLAD